MLTDNDKRSYKPVFGSSKVLPKSNPFAPMAWVKEGPVQNSPHIVTQY